MQDQFGAAAPQEQEQLSKLKARMSSQLLPFRDPNGFRKLVVLLTEPGLLPGPFVILLTTKAKLMAAFPKHVFSAALFCHSCRRTTCSLL